EFIALSALVIDPSTCDTTAVICSPTTSIPAIMSSEFWRNCAAATTPRVSVAWFSVDRISVIVVPALVRTSLTSVPSSMPSCCIAYSELELVSNAEATIPSNDMSVWKPVCTAISNSGAAKSSTSATSLNVVVASDCGGANTGPHCTQASPSDVWLTTPLVVTSASGSECTLLAPVPSSSTEPAILSGVPTNAGVSRDSPATS